MPNSHPIGALFDTKLTAQTIAQTTNARENPIFPAFIGQVSSSLVFLLDLICAKQQRVGMKEVLPSLSRTAE
jgi:hypothetical protein